MLTRFGELPDGCLLFETAARHNESAIAADLYSRQCERDFVRRLMSGAAV